MVGKLTEEVTGEPTGIAGESTTGAANDRCSRDEINSKMGRQVRRNKNWRVRDGVGVEREKEKEEKMESLFCSIYEFLTDAEKFDVTSSLWNNADFVDDLGTSSSLFISSGSFHHLKVADTGPISSTSYVNVADSVSSTSSSSSF